MQYLGFSLHSVWLLRNEEKWILNSFNPNGSSRLSKVEILIFPFLMSLIQNLIVLSQFICWAMWYSIWVSNYTLFCCLEKKRNAYWTCLIRMVVVDLEKFEIFIFLFLFFNGSYSKLYTTISMHLLSNLIQYLGFNLHSVWLLRVELIIELV